MGRMATYVIVWSGMLVLFYVTGLVPLESNPLLKLLISPETITTSDFWILLLGGLATLGGVALGIITRNIELGVMTAITPSLVLFIWNSISVFTVIRAENEMLAFLLFSPMLILFVLTGLEFWRGRD